MLMVVGGCDGMLGRCLDDVGFGVSVWYCWVQGLGFRGLGFRGLGLGV